MTKPKPVQRACLGCGEPINIAGGRKRCFTCSDTKMIADNRAAAARFNARRKKRTGAAA